MPETANGRRCPMDEGEVQAVIGRLGGVEALREGERSSTRLSCA